ncbi:MAG: T9SS type A sorting domain-containing protein [Rhodothermales bacterium]
MKRATRLWIFLILLSGIGWSSYAQIADVTIRQINSINPDSVAALEADGATLDFATISSRIYGNEVQNGDSVRVVAVVMSNPKNSGLANLSSGVPSRVHVFVRDTSAASTGPLGQGIQLVDGNYQATGVGDLLVGDVVEVIGTVAPFNQTMQISPVSARVLGDVTSFSLPASIMDPVTVTTADINDSVGASGEIQPNWEMVGNLRGQYVRIEGAQVMQRTLAPGGRPDWMVSTDGGTTAVTFYDTSLRFRNDRADYPSDFNPRSGDYEPPPPGSVVNLQGFLVMNNDNPFSVATPVTLTINPMEDSDVEITVSPPIISSIERSALIPGADAIDITASIVPDPSRTVASAELKYYTSSSPDTNTVAAGLVAGDTYTFTIPAVADGDFVTYWIGASDNVGGESMSDDFSYRVLVDGIDSIADIQETASGGPGDSPFAFLKIPMNITGVIMTQGSESGIYILQSDETLQPWTGIFLRGGSAGVGALNRGDVITVTEAYVVETERNNFPVTALDSLTFTVDGTATPYDYKVVPTSALTDPNVAEAHEGMMLRFEDVTITEADAGFGEWGFSSDGTVESQLKADDLSDGLTSSFASDTFVDGDVVTFIQGALGYSFGEYKLIPETATDIGDINVGLEEEVGPGDYALGQNYPNPFAERTTIEFALGASGRATLEVFDLLGRRVATLADGQLSAGIHSVAFDSKGLGSGMYVARLTAGDQVITKTMMLVK